VEPYGELVGSQTPRISTPALGELTPQTTDGFACLDWMRDNGFDPLPWQEALTLAVLERHPQRPDRRRWRTAVVVLPRQNGKSQWATALQGWRLATGDAEVAVTAAQTRAIAVEMLLRGARLLDVTTRDGANGRRYAGSGFERIELNNGSRWLVETMSPEAGRGLSVDHLHLDELRHAKSEDDGFAALEPTTTARPRGLVLVTSNAGTDSSVVLNGLIERGRAAAADPEYRGSLGLWEWSAPSDAALDDRQAWATANPSLGYTLDPEVLDNALATSSPATFRTERLSIRVTTDSAAIDAGAWEECADPDGTLEFARGRIAVAVDTAPCGHTTLCAAGVDQDGIVRVEAAAAWSSPAEARAELADLVARINPRKVAWFGNSPTAALAVDLRAAAGDRAVKLTDPSEACQAFASLVAGRRLRHGGQSLLDDHVAGATRMRKGSGWVFARRDMAAPVSGAYAAAGAVLLARQMPAPSSTRLIVAA
jgi:hypothetical protein